MGNETTSSKVSLSKTQWVKTQSNTPSVKAQPEVSQATVFVVDDDDAMLKSIRWLIESVGLHVKTFASAKEFLEGCSSDEGGCLILDIRMPAMSGLELQEQLKESAITLPMRKEFLCISHVVNTNA